MRSKIINQPNRLNGVMGLNPVNDGKPIRKLIINHLDRSTTYWLHPGNEKELLKYANGLVEHAGFFRFESGNTVTISHV